MATCKPWLLCCIVLVLGCAVALVCLCVASLAASECPRGTFRRAAVAADSRVCSEAGRSMLQQGGSAVDGAIAALLCTSVVNPQSMGIGGGSIVTLRNRTGHVSVYNFRETVPRSFKADLLSDCPTTFRVSTGATWIGVPGELRGYQTLHREYGKLPWAKLFEPTIKLARDGITMPPFLTKLLKESFVKDLVEKSSLCQVFCNKNKTVLKEGDILKFTKLAETMQVIADRGADAFYSGSVAEDLIKDIHEAGGTLDMEDLKNFKVRIMDTWKVPLGEANLYVAPPPAGGALLAFILKLMKEFNLTPNDLSGERQIRTYHHYIEVAKFANGQRRSIRDPQFNNPKGSDHLIDPFFIHRVKAMITSNRTHDAAFYSNVKPSSSISSLFPSGVPSDRFGTTHLSVLDEDGLAVSATSTINQLFGGAVYSPRTGIILNNELSDFCGRADALRAGEQPPSSMTPAVLELKSGGLLLIGGSGGSMITSAVALSIINRLWLGMDLKEAIAAPIIFVDSKNIANFEPGFNKSVVEELRAVGHSVGGWRHFFNVVNGLEQKASGCIAAVSDSRKGGEPAGY